MKSKLRLVLVASIVVVAAVAFQYSAAESQGGSVSDPLVTKSYVDLKISQIKNSVDDLFNKVILLESKVDNINLTAVQAPKETVTETSKETPSQEASEITPKGTTETTENSPQLFVVLELEPGSKLIMGASAEVVLRAGAATVIAGAKGDGLADLTTGDDLRGGAEVPLQHHLLVSRDDGRGFLITSKNTSYVLVKGKHRVE